MIGQGDALTRVCGARGARCPPRGEKRTYNDDRLCLASSQVIAICDRLRSSPLDADTGPQWGAIPPRHYCRSDVGTGIHCSGSRLGGKVQGGQQGAQGQGRQRSSASGRPPGRGRRAELNRSTIAEILVFDLIRTLGLREVSAGTVQHGQWFVRTGPTYYARQGHDRERAIISPATAEGLPPEMLGEAVPNATVLEKLPWKPSITSSPPWNGKACGSCRAHKRPACPRIMAPGALRLITAAARSGIFAVCVTLAVRRA